MKNTIKAKVIGRSLFQARCIRRSYRNRGRVARAHTQKNTTAPLSLAVPRIEPLLINNILLNTLKAKILPYSAINKSTKPPAPNSMLKPETSSDSPSAKSKGVRFVSARLETSQAQKRRGVKRAKGIRLFSVSTRGNLDVK